MDAEDGESPKTPGEPPDGVAEPADASRRPHPLNPSPVGAVAAGHAVVIAKPQTSGLLPQTVSRRGVLRTAFWAGLGLTLLAIATTIVYALYPRRAPANGGQQLIGTSAVSPFGGVIQVGTVDQLAPGQKMHNLDARAWVVRLDAAQAKHNPPAPEGSILALYHKCPHLGCTVPYRADFSREDPRNGQTYAGWFLCPCHGSTYSDAGVRVFGPAPRSMDMFPLTIENGRMSVDTSKIITGTTQDPANAVVP